jgi:sterol desaturase/sphingolipid hydroxylase (fatty acid hydroxylase superfamily)
MKLLASILAAMALVAAVETVIPLHARGRQHRAHLGPNLALMLVAFVTNMVMNAGLLLLAAQSFGLLHWLAVGPVAAAVAGIVVLDLSWYALHRAMHRVPGLWRVHRVHHSDPVIDVTTTIRQHPLESVLRYATLAFVVTIFGIGPAAFAIYRAWSVFAGLVEHANVRLPRWLDRGLALVIVSPDMHKVHHGRDMRDADTNFGNMFSLHDRVLGTFTPAARGRTVVCGLDGFDEQSTADLLAMPFRDRVRSAALRA